MDTVAKIRSEQGAPSIDLFFGGTDGWIRLPPNPPIGYFHPDPLVYPDTPFTTYIFGFRNLTDYDAGLREIFRVLREGGEVGILDFGQPRGVLGAAYGFYFRRVLPRVGTWISGVRGPYAYLPASVGRFPTPEAMLERMKAAGFSEVSWTPYTFGIAGLYRGKVVGR